MRDRVALYNTYEISYSKTGVLIKMFIYMNQRPSQGTSFFYPALLPCFTSLCPALTGIHEFFLPCPEGRAGRPRAFTLIECFPCSFKCAGKPKHLHHAALDDDSFIIILNFCC